MKNNLKSSIIALSIIILFSSSLLAKPNNNNLGSEVHSNTLTSNELKNIYKQTYIKGFNIKSGDQFGRAVALSEDTMVIGARFNDSNAIGINGEEDENAFPITDSGAVYVYIRENNEWVMQAFIKPPEQIFDFGFGRSIAISGDTIVIGMAGFTNGPAERIYVYQRTIDIWILQSTIFTIFNIELFGFSVSISGDTILVGAPFADLGGDYEGGAFVYTRTNNEWSKEATLTASNPEFLDLFGNSVAIENNTVVIGARNESSNAIGINGDEEDNSARKSGAVYVFNRVGTEWTQEAYIKSSQSKSQDKFGWSVALSDGTIAVGAKGANFNDVDIFEGSAYVFVKEGDDWTEEARLLPGATEIDDQFGYSIALSGDNLIVGAYYEDSSSIGVNGDNSNNSSLQSGATYVYKRDSGIWNQQFYLKASNTDTNDRFGFSVAVSGNTYVVGAPFEDSSAIDANPLDNSSIDSGAVYTYELFEPNDFQLQAGHSALWFNSDQSGHGINVYVLEDNRILMFWYVYDDEGNPIWLLGVGTHDGIRASLDVTIYKGGMFPPNFNANDVDSTSWGRFEIEFSSCDAGEFTWIPVAENGFNAGQMNIERLNKTLGLECGDELGIIKNSAKIVMSNSNANVGSFALQDAHSALWFDPNQSGHGINVYMLEDNRILAFWYVYDDAGNPIWLLGIGTHDGVKAVLDVSFFNGPMFPPNFNSSDLNSTNWGTFEIEFSGCNAGLFKWLPVTDNGFSAGEMNIERLNNTLGLTCIE